MNNFLIFLKISNVKKFILQFSLCFLILFFFSTVIFLKFEFGKITVDQLFFHLRYWSNISTFYDLKLATRYINYCLVPSLLISTLQASLQQMLEMRHPSRWRRISAVFFGSKLVVLLIAVFFAVTEFKIIDYVKGFFVTDCLRAGYAMPISIQISPENPKNLILIYVESLENSYTESKFFGKNLIDEMTQLNGSSFNQFTQLENTGWTMAALVASQCALPLLSVLNVEPNAQGEILKSILPRATCLGDTLKNLGYTNIFLGGADLAFSGKGAFLINHGYDQSFGLGQWRKSPDLVDSDFNDWGLNDGSLFLQARKTLKALVKSQKPFNLTILTLNTHEPEGYLSNGCKKDLSRPFESVLECSARDIANFVKDAISEGLLKNTRIVILGDHLARLNSLSSKLEVIPERTMFNSWISDVEFLKNRDQIVHFDIAPTILNFIDVGIDQGRYGLGISGLQNPDQWIDPDRINVLQACMLNGSSSFYNNLWNGFSK